MRNLRGRRAFLTGAGSGIGRALTLELARAGTNLFLVDVDDESLSGVARETAASGVETFTHVCDLANRRQLEEMTESVRERWGHFDLLINNAGVAFYGPTDTMTQEQWDRLLGVNLIAPIHITRAFLPMLLDRPDAHIVNMCSISGIVAGGRFAAYHVSKFGLLGFTDALRAEYGRRGLGVTAMCPGPVTTNLYSAAAAGRPQTVPTPPAWTCTSPENVARRTLRAVRRNRRMVLITPTAHGLYQLKRFAPGLIDFMNTFSRKRLQRMLASRFGRTPDPAVSETPEQPRRAA